MVDLFIDFFQKKIQSSTTQTPLLITIRVESISKTRLLIMYRCSQKSLMLCQQVALQH